MRFRICLCRMSEDVAGTEGATKFTIARERSASNEDIPPELAAEPCVDCGLDTRPAWMPCILSSIAGPLWWRECRVEHPYQR